MRIIIAFGLILVLFLSACAVSQQPVEQVTDPESSIEEQIEEQIEEEIQVEEPKEVTSGEIRILGKGGFEPDELTVSEGSTLTWFNDDERSIVLSIFKDGKFYQNSGLIKAGERFELTLNETGSYEYWATAYGVKAKITVE